MSATPNGGQTAGVRAVVVLPFDPEWSARFAMAAVEVAQALEAVVAVHHIGSTAVPGLDAKPIIDLLVEAVDLAAVDARTAAMAALGYESLGENGLPGRRFFRRDDEAGERTHHVHLWETGHQDLQRHLAFRDFLIAHPRHAAEYGALKRQLAQQHPRDMDAYIDGKDALVQDLEARALAWRERRSERI